MVVAAEWDRRMLAYGDVGDDDNRRKQVCDDGLACGDIRDA